jgi:hypothetical protein
VDEYVIGSVHGYVDNLTTYHRNGSTDCLAFRDNLSSAKAIYVPEYPQIYRQTTCTATRDRIVFYTISGSANNPIVFTNRPYTDPYLFDISILLEIQPVTVFNPLELCIANTTMPDALTFYPILFPCFSSTSRMDIKLVRPTSGTARYQ